MNTFDNNTLNKQKIVNNNSNKNLKIKQCEPS